MISISEKELAALGIELVDSDKLSSDKSIIINKLNELDFINITIEDLYELVASENNVDKLANGTEVANVKSNEYITNGIFTDSKIKNVSRHKVSKSKWRIDIPNKEPLYMTEDHSIIIYRDGELVECKPKDIKATDYLVVK